MEKKVNTVINYVAIFFIIYFIYILIKLWWWFALLMTLFSIITWIRESIADFTYALDYIRNSWWMVIYSFVMYCTFISVVGLFFKKKWARVGIIIYAITELIGLVSGKTVDLYLGIQEGLKNFDAKPDYVSFMIMGIVSVLALIFLTRPKVKEMFR